MEDYTCWVAVQTPILLKCIWASCSRYHRKSSSLCTRLSNLIATDWQKNEEFMSFLRIGLMFCGVLLLMTEVDAQRRGWGSRPSPEIGVRGGRDYDLDIWSAGGQFRLPLGRRGRLQLVPSGDVFFAEGEADWQANVDVLYGTERGGGLYFGGGMGYSNRTGVQERVVNRIVGLRLSERLYLENRWTNIDGKSLFRVVVGYNLSLGKRRDSAAEIFDALAPER